MKATEFFVRRPVLFWSLMAAILIAGLLSFIRMPKLEDPAVAVKQAMVMVPYPGASAHEVELKVAQMMEDELRALPNVKKVKSECRNGSAMLTVEFQMTVLNRDLEQHFDLLRRKVNDAASRLPEGCYDPVVIDDMMDVYGIFYSLTADGYDYPEMYRYAKFLRRELLDMKGVKRILIAGNRDEVINIILSKEQIARNGVIPTQITSALQQAGKTVNAGAYPTGDERIALYVDSAVDDVEEIRNLEIRTMDGRQLRIGDVARVERGYAAPQRNGFFVDGRPALALCIAMESSAIVPDVGKAVDARLAEAMRQLPAGFQTEKIFFQPDKVSEAISSFMWNLAGSRQKAGRHLRSGWEYRPSTPFAGRRTDYPRRLRPQRVQQPLSGLSPAQGALLRLPVLRAAVPTDAGHPKADPGRGHRLRPTAPDDHGKLSGAE